MALGAQSGLVSNLQVTHRANTDASFIDQTVASLGTGFVWARGSTALQRRASTATQGWLDGEDHERGVNLNLGVAHRFGDYEAALSLRGGTLEYEQPASQILDADRYLAGLSLTRLNIGEHSGRIGVALLVGKDEAQPGRLALRQRPLRRAAVRELAAAAAVERVSSKCASMTSDYDGSFFGAEPQGRAARRHRCARLPELSGREMERGAPRSLHEERLERLALRIRPRRSGRLHPAQLLRRSTLHELQTRHPPR